jgi:hypothetical protein
MNIGYHTRLWSNNVVKVVGGSFGGQIDMETVNRLANLFTVTVSNSGNPVFVDREGREVRLYISVDADKTIVGQEALAAWREDRRVQEQGDQERLEQEAEEVDRLMGGLTHDEIVRRLSGGSKETT